MPTIRNDTTTKKSYFYTDENGSKINGILEAGATFSCECIIYHDGSITNVSDDPFYNPFANSTEITGTSQTVNLQAGTDDIEIWNDSAAMLTVYLQSVSNNPSFRVFPYSVREVKNLRNRINKIIISASIAIAATECFVTEFNRKEGF